MAESFSKVSAIIMALFIMIFYPLTRSLYTADLAVSLLVRNETKQFCDNVRKKGYISREAYESFIDTLANTEYLYDVQLYHYRTVYYPLRLGDPGYSSDHTFTTYEEVYATTHILEVLYDQERDYKLSYGDTFKVTVFKKQQSPYQVVTFWLGFTGENIIYAVYGGMVSGE